MKKLTIAILVALAFAAGVFATKIEPARTLQNVTVSDVTGLSVYKSTSGSLLVSVTYGIRDESGNVVYQHSINDLAISGAARTSLINWITSNALPVINSQEGL